MFGIDFTEMLIIAVVALVVIGPERLPRVARTVGHLIGRMQRYVNEVKADINRELELEELRKFKREFEDAAQSAQNSIRDTVEHARAELAQAKTEVGAAAESLRDELSSVGTLSGRTAGRSDPRVLGLALLQIEQPQQRAHATAPDATSRSISSGVKASQSATTAAV